MAKTYIVPINLAQLELQNARIQNLGSAPGSPVEGQIYYDSTGGNKKIYFWNGTAWRSMDATAASVGFPLLGPATSGGVSAPDYSWTGDTGTGMYSPVDGTIGLSSAGSASLTASGSLVSSLRQLQIIDGTSGSPGIRLTTDQTGLYSGGAGTLGFSGAGSSLGTWAAAALTVAAGDVRLANSGLFRIGTAAGDVALNKDATGVLGVRLGDNSAYGGLKALTLESTGAITVGTNAILSATGKAIFDNTSNGGLIKKDGTNALAIRNQADSAYAVLRVADPVGVNDATSKQYVDNVASGLTTKPAVLVATTGVETFTIASGAVTQIAGTTVDGQSPAVNDRILIKNAPAATGVGSVVETVQPGNGIYVVTNNTTNLTVARATDMDTWAEVPSAYVWVEKGTPPNNDTGWVCTSDPGGVINTTNISWVLFASASSLIAGAGLNKLGNVIDLVVTGSGITVNANDIALDATLQALAAFNTNGLVTQTAADTFTGRTLTGTASRISISNGNGVSGNPTVDIDAAYVGQSTITTLGTITTGVWTGTTIAIANGGTGQTTAKTARETGLGAAGYYSTATHGAGTTITITQATHGLRSTTGIVVQTQIESTGEVVEADYSVASGGDVTVTFAVSQGANTIRVTLIG